MVYMNRRSVDIVVSIAESIRTALAIYAEKHPDHHYPVNITTYDELRSLADRHGVAVPSNPKEIEIDQFYYISRNSEHYKLTIVADVPKDTPNGKFVVITPESVTRNITDIKRYSEEMSYARNLVEKGDNTEAKKIIADILNNSEDENVIAEAMYYQVLWRFSSNESDTFEKLREFYPNSKYVSRLETVVTAREKELKEKVEKWLGNGFVYISPGTYTRGSPPDEPYRDNDEKQHRVSLTKGFYIQTTEVPQGLWNAVMGNNPSYFQHCGDDCPVESISWNDVQEFIRKLNQLEGSEVYRLPTEAEWEYAARAGRDTPFSFGQCISTDQENFNPAPIGFCYDKETYKKAYEKPRKYRGKTIPIASLLPNAWGLYDMHGNVSEWCQDWYGNYPSDFAADPNGPSGGSTRVRRGGNWIYAIGECRSADRLSTEPEGRSNHLGFRLLKNP